MYGDGCSIMAAAIITHIHCNSVIQMIFVSNFIVLRLIIDLLKMKV